MPKNQIFIDYEKSINAALDANEITRDNLLEILDPKSSVVSNNQTLQKLQEDIRDSTNPERQRSILVAVSLAALGDKLSLVYNLFVRPETDRAILPLICDGWYLNDALDTERACNAFSILLTSSRLQQFYFLANTLSEEKLQLLLNAIQRSSIRELGIDFIDRDDDNLKRVDRLLDIIPGSQLKSLFINASDAQNLATRIDSHTPLPMWDDQRFEHFLQQIKHLDSLNLSKNDLGSMSDVRVKKLLAQSLNLSTLILTKNNLQNWFNSPQIRDVF